MVKKLLFGIIVPVLAFSTLQDEKAEDPLYSLTGCEWKMSLGDLLKDAQKEKKLVLWIESMGILNCPVVTPCS